MNRGDINIIPEYFKRYVELIPEDMGAHEALVKYGSDYVLGQREKYKGIGDRVYEAGKWNIKQSLVHLIDGERVFAYRALRFARGDQTPLPGFDQDLYARAADVSSRSLESILEEFQATRNATIQLYKSFGNEELRCVGKASGMDVSVLALGFMISGHVVHHQKIFEERYYPLVDLTIG